MRASEELAKHVEGEKGPFSSADKAWLGRVDTSRLWAEALAEEHAAKEQKAAFRYGPQVARLRRAASAAKSAFEGADCAGVPRNEMVGVFDGLARLEGAEAHEAHKCIHVHQVRRLDSG